jgi:hypothetical protein
MIKTFLVQENPPPTPIPLHARGPLKTEPDQSLHPPDSKTRPPANNRAASDWVLRAREMKRKNREKKHILIPTRDGNRNETQNAPDQPKSNASPLYRSPYKKIQSIQPAALQNARYVCDACMQICSSANVPCCDVISPNAEKEKEKYEKQENCPTMKNQTECANQEKKKDGVYCSLLVVTVCPSHPLSYPAHPAKPKHDQAISLL